MLARLILALLALALFLAAGLAAAGCSTVEGAGKDLQYASERTADALNGDDDDDDD